MCVSCTKTIKSPIYAVDFVLERYVPAFLGTAPLALAIRHGVRGGRRYFRLITKREHFFPQHVHKCGETIISSNNVHATTAPERQHTYFKCLDVSLTRPRFSTMPKKRTTKCRRGNFVVVTPRKLQHSDGMPDRAKRVVNRVQGRPAAPKSARRSVRVVYRVHASCATVRVNPISPGPSGSRRAVSRYVGGYNHMVQRPECGQRMYNNKYSCSASFRVRTRRQA